MIDQASTPDEARGEPPGHQRRRMAKIMTAFRLTRDQHDFDLGARPVVIV